MGVWKGTGRGSRFLSVAPGPGMRAPQDPPLCILCVAGGILAGVISDRLEKRASTCGLMLLLAAPTVSMHPCLPPRPETAILLPSSKHSPSTRPRLLRAWLMASEYPLAHRVSLQSPSAAWSCRAALCCSCSLGRHLPFPPPPRPPTQPPAYLWGPSTFPASPGSVDPAHHDHTGLVLLYSLVTHGLPLCASVSPSGKRG